MSPRLRKLLVKFNEFQPLLITLALTVLMAVLYQLAPGWIASIDNNPYTPYYNASEFHDIIRKSLKVFAYTGITIALMMMIFPGTWSRLEFMMRADNYEPRWLRDTFIFLSFLVLLFSLVLS
jgi:hypothetical protein